MILVFSVDRLGICVVLFLATGLVGDASSFFLGSSTTGSISTLADGEGTDGSGIGVSTFFFHHQIRAVPGQLLNLGGQFSLKLAQHAGVGFYDFYIQGQLLRAD